MIPPYLGPGSRMGHPDDDRVPRTFRGFDPATPVSGQHTEQCPDARHVFDLLVTTGEYREYLGDIDGVEGALEIRLVGTCVRCGVIWRMEGTELDQRKAGADRLDPNPLRAGHLLAQQVRRDTWYTDPDRYNTYVVHRAVATGPIEHPAGRIDWGCTPRGRYYYHGHLFDGNDVEAPTALACLRKLAKATAPQVQA